MGLLIYPLIQGREAGWPAWTYVMIAGSAVSFAALGAVAPAERRSGRDPLDRGEHVPHRAYSAGLGTIVVFFAGMIGMLLVLTLFLQFGEHFSAIHAGLTLAPFALGTAIGATLAGGAAGAALRAARAAARRAWSCRRNPVGAPPVAGPRAATPAR